MWIKNISGEEQLRITCYKNGKDLKDRTIKPNQTIEVVADYYKDKPMIWKITDKPRPRYYNEWFRDISIGIIMLIIGIFLGKLIG